MKQTANMTKITTTQPEDANIDFSDKFISNNAAKKAHASGTTTGLQSTGKITPLELDVLDELENDLNNIHV